nr:MBL fold metallo-hydrolase [Acidobacteriota bacterium]
MTTTNTQSGTNVHEICEDIYRINTPLSVVPGGFSFNQYLIMDDEPLLFHTGPRKLFPLVSEAVASVMPVERLRYLSFSHVEADECGSLNDWLKVAPRSAPLCGRVAALVSIEDLADRPPRALADGETVSLGKHSVQW